MDFCYSYTYKCSKNRSIGVTYYINDEIKQLTDSPKTYRVLFKRICGVITATHMMINVHIWVILNVTLPHLCLATWISHKRSWAEILFMSTMHTMLWDGLKRLRGPHSGNKCLVILKFIRLEVGFLVCTSLFIIQLQWIRNRSKIENSKVINRNNGFVWQRVTSRLDFHI